MPIFRLAENVPDVYIRGSRDFQMLCRLYDCVLGGVKSDADSITDVTDTELCRQNILMELQTKLGFFTYKDIIQDDLRQVLAQFPYIIKNKGSKLGIIQQVNMFLKIKHIKTSTYVNVINKDQVKPYTVEIGIESTVQDVSILTEVFKYILPTGYTVDFFFYTSINDLTEMQNHNTADILIVENDQDAQVFSFDEYIQST